MLVVIWTDWYAYHVARLRGLLSVPALTGRVVGIELVGGIGVHAGLKFREKPPADLPILTLLPDQSWQQAGQLRLAILLWRALGQLNPQAVLVPGYATLPALAAALWARLHRRPSILMTESTAYDHRRSPWKENSKSILLRTLFDSAIAGGKAHLRYLEQLGFPSASVRRFYDVVDNETISTQAARWRQLSPRNPALPRSPYFLYVGRLAPEKNADGLLTAWLNYRQQGGDWPLVLVGDGPSAPLLRQQIESSPHQSAVYFAGLRTSAELPEYYAFAGCFVLSSAREPWGLVVNEAMASGLPVLVSTRCGSAEDLVADGVNGYTFDPASPTQLTALMHRVSDLAPATRSAMGAHSTRLITAYSPYNFGCEVASLLNTGGH